ncbi:TPA: transcriptional regulator [Pseudomonas aeruginosa]|nr:transcriptional regulator [Pseudomonas aeruginosa]HCF4137849.1 transcriptional regulator [Pseudomonas aeruginosa]HCL3672830.1 transcriptional regulator [Pseudomonas aeruginosa]HCL3876879.1 transcriptional regulator [Pseudomonas aeruginosa]
MRESISAEALKILVVAGAARDLRAIPAPSGHVWQFQVRYSPDGQYYPLRSRRELVRVFGSLDSLNRYANRLGIHTYSVEL